MKYKAIVDFTDLRDGGYQYKSGDAYPHTGKPDAQRVKQLITPTAMRGALIEAVSEPTKRKAKKE